MRSISNQKFLATLGATEASSSVTESLRWVEGLSDRSFSFLVVGGVVGGEEGVLLIIIILLLLLFKLLLFLVEELVGVPHLSVVGELLLFCLEYISLLGGLAKSKSNNIKQEKNWLGIELNLYDRI